MGGLAAMTQAPPFSSQHYCLFVSKCAARFDDVELQAARTTEHSYAAAQFAQLFGVASHLSEITPSSQTFLSFSSAVAAKGCLNMLRRTCASSIRLFSTAQRSAKALVYDTPGEPLGVLKLVQQPLKAPGPGQIEVRFLQVQSNCAFMGGMSLRNIATACTIEVDRGPHWVIRL